MFMFSVDLRGLITSVDERLPALLYKGMENKRDLNVFIPDTINYGRKRKGITLPGP